MLTDEQVEKAARLVCESRGLDPEAYNPLTLDGPGCLTWWQSIVPDIREHEQFHEALDACDGEIDLIG